MKKLNFIPKKTKLYREGINIDEKDIAVDFFDEIDAGALNCSSGCKMDVRAAGEFGGKAIHLSMFYDYILGKDSNDSTILVPLKKK